MPQERLLNCSNFNFKSSRPNNNHFKKQSILSTCIPTCMYTFLAAILFLSPKSIIYNFNNEEDIWKAGDLAENKPFTITSLTNKYLMLITILFLVWFSQNSCLPVHTHEIYQCLNSDTYTNCYLSVLLFFLLLW